MNTYLFFNGNCREAFQFYAQIFDSEIASLVTYGDMPASEQGMDANPKLIAHVSLKVGSSVLMGGDSPPAYFKVQQGFCVYHSVASIAEAERIFAALSDGGVVRMPLEETFWAARFGMADDKFGIPWMISYDKNA